MDDINGRAMFIMNTRKGPERCRQSTFNAEMTRDVDDDIVNTRDMCGVCTDHKATRMPISVSFICSVTCLLYVFLILTVM